MTSHIIGTYLLTCHLDSPLKDIVQLPMMSADQVSVPQDSVPQDSVPQDSVPQDSVPQDSVLSVGCGSFRTSALGKRRLQTL